MVGAEAWVHLSNSSVYHSKELLNRLDRTAAKAGGEENLSSYAVEYERALWKWNLHFAVNRIICSRVRRIVRLLAQRHQ